MLNQRKGHLSASMSPLVWAGNTSITWVFYVLTLKLWGQIRCFLLDSTLGFPHERSHLCVWVGVCDVATFRVKNKGSKCLFSLWIAVPLVECDSVLMRWRWMIGWPVFIQETKKKKQKKKNVDAHNFLIYLNLVWELQQRGKILCG